MVWGSTSTAARATARASWSTWSRTSRHGAGIVINAGAYTHTSVAIRDALATVTCPVVEVHISNVHARERFRHHSYLSAVVTGVIVGLGPQGYELAIAAVAARASTT